METETIWPPFCIRHFQIYFLVQKCCIVFQIANKCVSKVGAQSTIYKRWFKWWLDAEEATSLYRHQQWFTIPLYICVIAVASLLPIRFNFNPVGISSYIYYKMLGEITYPFLISTVATLQFGNGKVISSHTLLGMWLLIHVRMEVNAC